MLKAATFSGRAIGPAIATAANSMVVRVVSCMVEVVGLWVSCSLSEFVESRTELDVEIHRCSRGRDRSSYAKVVVWLH